MTGRDVLPRGARPTYYSPVFLTLVLTVVIPQVCLSPLRRSVPVIIRVPCTSVTFLLCVSNDIQNSSHKPTPSPSLSYSRTHAHRSIGYRNISQILTESVTRLIHLRVYDNRGSSSKSAPSQSSLCYSRTHAHRSIGYCNIPQPLTESVASMHTGPLVITTSPSLWLNPT